MNHLCLANQATGLIISFAKLAKMQYLDYVLHKNDNYCQKKQRNPNEQGSMQKII
jgi:hypothetical protein